MLGIDFAREFSVPPGDYPNQLRVTGVKQSFKELPKPPKNCLILAGINSCFGILANVLENEPVSWQIGSFL
jgi:hypothetical protein